MDNTNNINKLIQSVSGIQGYAASDPRFAHSQYERVIKAMPKLFKEDLRNLPDDGDPDALASLYNRLSLAINKKHPHVIHDKDGWSVMNNSWLYKGFDKGYTLHSLPKPLHSGPSIMKDALKYQQANGGYVNPTEPKFNGMSGDLFGNMDVDPGKITPFPRPSRGPNIMEEAIKYQKDNGGYMDPPVDPPAGSGGGINDWLHRNSKNIAIGAAATGAAALALGYAYKKRKERQERERQLLAEKATTPARM